MSIPSVPHPRASRQVATKLHIVRDEQPAAVAPPVALTLTLSPSGGGQVSGPGLAIAATHIATDAGGRLTLTTACGLTLTLDASATSPRSTSQETHRQRVLAALSEVGEATRRTLMDATGISSPTVLANLLKSLVDAREVVRVRKGVYALAGASTPTPTDAPETVPATTDDTPDAPPEVSALAPEIAHLSEAERRERVHMADTSAKILGRDFDKAAAERYYGIAPIGEATPPPPPTNDVTARLPPRQMYASVEEDIDAMHVRDLIHSISGEHYEASPEGHKMVIGDSHVTSPVTSPPRRTFTDVFRPSTASVDIAELFPANFFDPWPEREPTAEELDRDYQEWEYSQRNPTPAKRGRGRPRKK